MMKNVYSVGQVNAYIKNMFAQDFMMNKIYVKGEVSNCKYHPSGHIYFTLKDETGSLHAVMFAGSRKGLNFRMRNGDNVIALGSVAVYERDGKYQMYVREIIQDGAGLLHQRFEALKNELKEMGMFAPEYKQPIPKYIKNLGIVTASAGAAIRDIQNIANRRNPYIQLILYPALVQGEGAAVSIVKGIRALEQEGVDLIIVGRGGGSMEDLWAFNEEIVAHAIFECSIPVISAVGHETDVTIADYVADLRAPTPSAAAELAVYDIREFTENLMGMRLSMTQTFRNKLELEQEKIRQLAVNLSLLKPQNLINEKRQICLELEQRLMALMKQGLVERRHRLELFLEMLNGLSPQKKLSQGYSYVSDEAGRGIGDVKCLKEGDRLTIHMQNGVVKALVEEIKAEQDESM